VICLSWVSLRLPVLTDKCTARLHVFVSFMADLMFSDLKNHWCLEHNAQTPEQWGRIWLCFCYTQADISTLMMLTDIMYWWRPNAVPFSF
jgi:hypothetical protein